MVVANMVNCWRRTEFLENLGFLDFIRARVRVKLGKRIAHGDAFGREFGI